MTAVAEPPVSTVPQVLPTKLQLVVLAGNPNVGKSVFFNAFTGLYATVSNFPGTTVDIPNGLMLGAENIQVKDTPGVYGLSGMSEEETVAEKTILAADVIINVVSAVSLERDLFLTQQLIDYGKPMVIAVNQMDEAEAHHLHLDLAQLSGFLGVPVIPCTAIAGEGLDAVKDAVRMSRGDTPEPTSPTRQTRPLVGNPMPDSPPPAELMELEKGDFARRMNIYGARRNYVNALVSRVVTRVDKDASLGRRLSRTFGDLLLNPVIGLASGLLVLMALYQIVGVWVAGDLVDLTEGMVMLQYVVPWIQKAFQAVLNEASPLYQILAGEFGVFTMSIQYIFGVLFPLVFGFYIYISVLEDCGYLPRIAVLSDGLLNKIGLNGRAVIPLILGLGCVTMATVSTRVLTSQRERTIASTLLAVTIPCSAQLGVLMGLIAVTGGLKAWMVYCGILFTTLIGLGTLLNGVLPGKSSALIMDLPPMRMPSFKNIAQKTWVRTKVFLKEASPLFVLGSFLVAVLQVTGLLAQIQVWLAPLTESLLHLPGEAARAFVMGMVRRDFGAAGLYFLAESMTAIQMMTALIVITLFVPCIASATVIWKERGLKESIAVILGSWVLAFAMGAAVCRVLEIVPVL